MVKPQVHTFQIWDTKMALDVNSGSIFEVDDLVYDVLEFYGETSPRDIVSRLNGKYKESDIIEAIKELDTLKAQGLIFTEADLEEALESLKQKKYVKALCLNVAHDCNLRCRYCFASKGDYHGARQLMDKEVARAAVDFLIEHSGDIKNVEIDFFGGEPLMAFDTIKYVVSYAKSIEESCGKKFHFTVTTNCTLLNSEIVDYLHNNMDNIVMSLDGRKNVNDKMRIRANGSGTYDQVVSNIKKVVELRKRDGKDYYVRGTFTKHNLDFAEDALHMADLGFEEISIEPVVGADKDFLIGHEDLETIYQQYDRIAKEYVKRRASGKNPFRFYHFNIDIYKGPCIQKRLSACGAGREYLAVTPDGQIYPCHQFIGYKEFLLGNVFEKKLDDGVIDKLKDTHVLAKQNCASCWAKFFCSGGCNANNYQVNGDLNIPYDIACSMQKKRIEYALYLAVKTSKENKKNRLIC
ncbi:MAG: thioether cross-link-forming SCIFF peptide maturase [Thermosediminibacteraceae bacterium]|nr:thioether cross-link-forming SCIFF peptide maturase [Thermosediminibacteraceae bacterium]